MPHPTQKTRTPSQDIFDPAFVKGVFDRCGPHYRWWSQIASFGFVWVWRKQCINALNLPHGDNKVVFDLMAGTGETWPMLLRRFPRLSKIRAVDISSTMVQRATERLHAMRASYIDIQEANILTQHLDPQSADAIVCSFGLKTFDPAQQAKIAGQVARALKPGGAFSFVEASDPKGWMFRGLYRLYMDNVLPLIERTFLRGAQDFAMIGDYTKAFGDCGHFAKCLEQNGLNVTYTKLFFGCASLVSGSKPA